MGKAAFEIPEGIVQVYTNAMSVIVTPWDIVLLYGSTDLPGSIRAGGQVVPVIRAEVAIIMSPQHAKAAVKALQAVVDQYEKQFGELHIPEMPS